MSQEDKNVSLDELYATIDSFYTEHPEIVPVINKQLSETVTSTPQQVKNIDTSSNLTKPIQQTMDTFKPTTTFIDYQEVFLSAEEINSLKPVPDRTITQLLVLFAGKGTRPYMLDGALLARTADDTYIKIVPYINKKGKNEGYVSYNFVVINYRTLNFIIDKYIQLLTSTKNYADLLDYDDGDEPPKDTVFDENDAEMVFGNKAIHKPMPKVKSAIVDDDFSDYDTDTLSTLKEMLKARKLSTYEHLEARTLSAKLASQVKLYDEDRELLSYLQAVVNHVYKELEKPYKSPYAPYIDTFYISGHHLSKWVYDPVEYTEKITNGDGKWSIDHIKQGIEYRSDNRPENLRIKSVGFNSGRTSRSIPVTYKGTPYVSIASYCIATGAGNTDTIEDIKASLRLDETKEYNDRVYTLSADTKELIAVDVEVKAPQITFNGTPFPSLKAFAKAVNIDYDKIQKGISRARKDGKTEYRPKNEKYTFYLGSDDSITIK